MNPRVKNLTIIANYKLKIQFDNGEEGIYDCASLLDFGVFKELRDANYFMQAKVLDGTVVWPHEQDICPDTLYLDSIKNTEKALDTELQPIFGRRMPGIDFFRWHERDF